MRGVSERTVQRDWSKARLFLRHVMRGWAEIEPEIVRREPLGRS